MKLVICIPARYKSSRLPGKPLLKINGKTIINHVYEKALELKKKYDIFDLVVLSDDMCIKKEVDRFGGNCCLIMEDCINGTDRIIHYLKKYYSMNNIKLDNKIIVNIQGDEPFINPNNIIKAIDNYIENIDDKNIVCSTIHHKTRDIDTIKLKSRGKLVLDNNNNIMYCSRNVIPSNKNNNIVPDIDYYIHIGIFVFNGTYLINHYDNNNTRLQLIEDIEWMKIMEQGFKINSVEVEESERGVDTIDDYNYLVNKYKN
jgi:3-deoxy-manno-octulosonate cytidylyltransferase (CMP-KDO synthetase)